MNRNPTDRLREILSSYGADPARWPPRDREQLAHLLPQVSSEAAVAAEIDAVLNSASHIIVPGGAEARLMRRLSAGAGTVIAFPKPRFYRWLIAMPLAASLALGVYLGAEGSLDSILPTSVTGTIASTDDEPADFSGVSDAESYAEEDLT